MKNPYLAEATKVAALRDQGDIRVADMRLTALRQQAQADPDDASLSHLRSALSQVARRSSNEETAALLRKQTSQLAQDLAARRAAREAKARDEESSTVADRIISRMRMSPGPVRPTELAESLGVHLSQVSRALRKLAASSQVKKTQPPLPAGDARGVWYTLADRGVVHVVDRNQAVAVARRLAVSPDLLWRALEEEADESTAVPASVGRRGDRVAH